MLKAECELIQSGLRGHPGCICAEARLHVLVSGGSLSEGQDATLQHRQLPATSTVEVGLRTTTS